MIKYVCNWLYVNPAGKESSGFLKVCRKNTCVLHLTGRKYNADVKYTLFANTSVSENIGDRAFQGYFQQLGVVTDLAYNYRTLEGYYRAWHNQFFKFPIPEKISKTLNNDEYLYTLPDSDYAFTAYVASL